MAKLTRTQKFADLRDSLANDKETSLSTQELSNYENRLNNLTEHLSTTETKIEEPVVKQEETPVTDVKYSWPDFDETPIDDLLNSFKMNDPFLWNDLPESKPVISEEEAKTVAASDDWHISDALNREEEIPVETVPAVEEKPEPVVQEGNPYLDYLNHIDPKIEEAYKEVEEKNKAEETLSAAPVEEEVATEEPQYKEMAELEDDSPLEAVSLDSVIDELPISKYPEEETDNHVIEHEETENTYFHEMIDEVSQYNKDNGTNTISQLTENMVNEVRHGEEEVRQEPVVTEEREDEEFSNTVSVEIAKIMDEVPVVEEKKEPEPVVVSEPVLEAEPVREEHPVLAKALEEEETEDVVEIKNLKEIEAEPVRETTSNTIPFVVAASDDEDIIDEDEEEGSNAVLNVILIVLIIILMVVLGLIVFYILKTKGIF